MRRIRIGVIGLGASGELFAQAVARQPDMEFVGVADLRLEQAQKIAHWAIVQPEKSGGWIIHHSVHDAGWFNKLPGIATSAFTNLSAQGGSYTKGWRRSGGVSCGRGAGPVSGEWKGGNGCGWSPA